MHRLISILFAACLFTGCASIHNLNHDKRIYGGVRDDLKVVSYPFSSSESRGGAPVDGLAAVMFIPCLIDTPFSLVLDSITLPYTSTKALKGNKEDSNKMPGHIP